MKIDRLFVPLTSEAFDDFEIYGKGVEIRRVNPNFCEKTVYAGRRVEIRKGYSGASIWGEIGRVVIAERLEDVISSFPLSIVEPRVTSLEEAVEENRRLLGEASNYIGFEVKFVRRSVI